MREIPHPADAGFGMTVPQGNNGDRGGGALSAPPPLSSPPKKMIVILSEAKNLPRYPAEHLKGSVIQGSAPARRRNLLPILNLP